MQIQIDTETRIADVQNKFTEVYPYLKVDFYKNSTPKKNQEKQ